MALRNNELGNADWLSITPKDTTALFLNFIACQEHGWKTLVALFLANKHLYSIFIDDNYTRRIFVNFNAAFPMLNHHFDLIRLDRVKHVLMANYLAPRRPFPQMKLLLNKYHLTSNQPELYNQENIYLLDSQKSRLQQILAPLNQRSDTGLAVTLPGGMRITSIGVIFAMFAIVVGIKGYLKISTLLGLQEDDSLPAETIYLGLIALVTLIAEFINQKCLENRSIPIRTQINEITDTLNSVKVEAENPNRLKKHSIDIAFENISSTYRFNVLFRVNKVLKDPRNPNIRHILATADENEILRNGGNNDPNQGYSLCSIL